MTNDNWVTMTEAAKAVGVSTAKLSSLARMGKIRTQKNPFDERVTLVDMEQLREMFPQDKRRR